ncbi:MAG: hypothetical protein JWO53_634 [Chlamydiia bacterium]|nr:hypothetical protein [Chlamydiia bacterium]
MKRAIILLVCCFFATNVMINDLFSASQYSYTEHSRKLLSKAKKSRSSKKKQGAAGPQGPQGTVGPCGSQGPAGERGEKGDRGDTGADGQNFIYPQIDGALTIHYHTLASSASFGNPLPTGTWQLLVIAPDLTITTGELISLQASPADKTLTITPVMKGIYTIMIYLKEKTSSSSPTGAFVSSLYIEHSSGKNIVDFTSWGFIPLQSQGQNQQFSYHLVVPD